MIPMPLMDVARATGGRLHDSAEGVLVRRVVHDSREVQAGDLFAAIRGQRFDGHDFVHQAAASGAAACLCDETWANAATSFPAVPVVIVDDTVASLGQLSAYYRRAVMSPQTTVIAVTGSNGKTTTKHMVHHVLSGTLKGRCAPRSFNNNIGVPLTLLTTDRDDRYVVVEIGTNAPGEIAALSSLVEPDVAVITSVGEAHLQGLGSVNDVAIEKASILKFVKPRGRAIVNTDRAELRRVLSDLRLDDFVSFGFESGTDIRVSNISGSMSETAFTIDNRHEVHLAIPGIHHATNAAATFAVGRWMGMEPADIVGRLATFKAVDGRTRRIELEGITLIDDSYNANPASMAAAIDTLALVDGCRRVFVMGDMFELGARSEELHAQIVRRAVQKGIEVLMAVGARSVEATKAIGDLAAGTEIIACEDAYGAEAVLTENLTHSDVVWIKGSRGMQLDRLVSALTHSHSVVAAVA